MVETITDGAVALERCGDLFAADPLGANMVASVLRPGVATSLLRVVDGGESLGAAVAWGPGVTVSRLRSGAMEPIADALPPDEDCELWGVAADMLAVAGRWMDRSGGSWEPIEFMQVLRLAELVAPDTTGRLATADELDLAVAARWALEFGDEVEHPRKGGLDAATAQMRRAADEHRLFGWRVGGRIVAQLLVSPNRFGVVRIGGVYTPPEHRDRGHAAGLTAAVSSTLRADGDVDDVILNTQVTNAVSNRLYRRLGFTLAFDVLSLRLVAGGRTVRTVDPL